MYKIFLGNIKLIRKKASRKNVELKQSCNKVLNAKRKDELTPKDLLTPCFLAMETKKSKLMVFALDSLQKLVNLKITENTSIRLQRKPLIDYIVEKMISCFDPREDDMKLHVQIVKVLLHMVVTCPTLSGKSLYGIVKCCFNIYLVAKHPVNQNTSKAALTTIYDTVINRMVDNAPVQKSTSRRRISTIAPSLTASPITSNVNTPVKKLTKPNQNRKESTWVNTLTPLHNKIVRETEGGRTQKKPLPPLPPPNTKIPPSPKKDEKLKKESPKKELKSEKEEIQDFVKSIISNIINIHDPQPPKENKEEVKEEEEEEVEGEQVEQVTPVVTPKKVELVEEVENVSDISTTSSSRSKKLKISRFEKDAVFLFTALCKISMRDLKKPTNQSSGHVAIKKSVLAMELMLEVLKTPTARYFKKYPTFLHHIKGYCFQSLVKNSVSPVPGLFSFSLSIFSVLLVHYGHAFKNDLYIIFNDIYLAMLTSDTCDFQHKIMILQYFKAICQKPKALARIYGSFDCDPMYEHNIFRKLVSSVSRLVYDKDATSWYNEYERMKLKKFCLTTNLTILKSISLIISQAKQSETKNPDEKTQGEYVDYEKLKHFKRRLERGFKKFNGEKGKKGVAYLIENGVIVIPTPTPTEKTKEKTKEEEKSESEAPTEKNEIIEEEEEEEESADEDTTPKLTKEESIANFLSRYLSRLDKQMLGNYLGEPSSQEILTHFLRHFDFASMKIVDAFRHLLNQFLLPLEEQQISRIIEAFANRYYENTLHLGMFENEDACFYLAYSILLLQTDIYKMTHKPPMDLQGYFNLTKGENGKKDFDKSLLEYIYNSISQNKLEFNPGVNMSTAAQNLKARMREKDAAEFKYLSLTNRMKAMFERESSRIMQETNEKISMMSQSDDSRLMLSSYAYVRPHRVVRLMFESVQNYMLRTLEQMYAESQSITELKQVIYGFSHGLNLSCVFMNDLARSSFMNVIEQCCGLYTSKYFDLRNIEFIKLILRVMARESNNLKSSWTNCIRCLSKLDFYRTLSSTSAQPTHHNSQNPDSPISPGTASTIRKLSTEEFNSMKVNNPANKNPDKIISTEKKEKDGSPSTKLNVHSYNAKKIFSQIESHSIDKIFDQSVTLSDHSLRYFIQALCEISGSDLHTYSEPRLFCLQKLVIVSDLNLHRECYDEYFEIVTDHCISISLHKTQMVGMTAMNQLKQLALKYIEFQIKQSNPNSTNMNTSFFDFLKPFERVMNMTATSPMKTFILECVNQIFCKYHTFIQQSEGTADLNKSLFLCIQNTVPLDPSRLATFSPSKKVKKRLEFDNFDADQDAVVTKAFDNLVYYMSSFFDEVKVRCAIDALVHFGLYCKNPVTQSKAIRYLYEIPKLFFANKKNGSTSTSRIVRVMKYVLFGYVRVMRTKYSRTRDEVISELSKFLKSYVFLQQKRTKKKIETEKKEEVEGEGEAEKKESEESEEDRIVRVQEGLVDVFESSDSGSSSTYGCRRTEILSFLIHTFFSELFVVPKSKNSNNDNETEEEEEEERKKIMISIKQHSVWMKESFPYFYKFLFYSVILKYFKYEDKNNKSKVTTHPIHILKTFLGLLLQYLFQFDMATRQLGTRLQVVNVLNDLLLTSLTSLASKNMKETNDKKKKTLKLPPNFFSIIFQFYSEVIRSLRPNELYSTPEISPTYIQAKTSTMLLFLQSVVKLGTIIGSNEHSLDCSEHTFVDLQFVCSNILYKTYIFSKSVNESGQYSVPAASLSKATILRIENNSIGGYLSLLLKIMKNYSDMEDEKIDEKKFAEVQKNKQFQFGEKKFIRGCKEIMTRYLIKTQIIKDVPEDDHFDNLEEKKHQYKEQIDAIVPIVILILKSFSSFNGQMIKKHLPDNYELFCKLILSPHEKVRSNLSGFFEKVGKELYQ